VSRPTPPADVVCFNCQVWLAREAEDASWTLRVRDEAGNISDQWPEHVWRCWNCEAKGFVNAFDFFPTKTHRRVRIPTRPML
jgi:hypothetical protein